ncbi:MAG: SGNH/GDSL hydrolase family protein [Clostridium sp.]
MKKFKRILAVILTMSMILAIPVLAGAATKTDLYFAAGDGMVTGYVNSGKNVTAYVEKVGYAVDTVPFTLAAESMTSADLLELIKSGKQDFNLKNATFSTVSIGYNDIMVPIVNVIGEAVLVDVRHTEDIIGAIQTKLSSASKEQLETYSKNIKIGLSDYFKNVAFEESVNKFADNLSEIAQEIRERSNGGFVIVTNIYNPYSNVSVGNVCIGDLIDEYIQEINEVITNNATHFGERNYIVADIYSAFKVGGLTNVDQSRYYLDPYPNQLGQNTIYKVIKPLIANEGIIVKPDYDGGDETTTPKPDTTTPGGNETTTPKPDTTTPGGNETSTPKPETTTPNGNETTTPNGNETTTPNNNDNNSGNNNGNNNGSNNNTNNGKGEYPGEPHLVQTGDLISTIALALMVVVALNAAVLTRKNAKNLFRK